MNTILPTKTQRTLIPTFVSYIQTLYLSIYLTFLDPIQLDVIRSQCRGPFFFKECRFRIENNFYIYCRNSDYYFINCLYKRLFRFQYINDILLRASSSIFIPPIFSPILSTAIPLEIKSI